MYQPQRRRFGGHFLQAVACLALLSLSGRADAQGSSDPGRPRPAPSPLIAVVSLSNQSVTVYSAQGKMMEAPVSTGMPGHETPAGIFSVLQMRRDHFSNLYNNASMPFMQRLTWSGIALHAGDLPGYPASHGCIRMPYDFAGQLFGLSKRGTRVVVARDNVSPVDFAHPALFKPGPLEPAPAPDVAAGSLYLTSAQAGAPGEISAAAAPMTRRALVAAKEAAAEAAARKVQEVRRAAARIERRAEAFEEALEEPEGARRRARERLEEADLLMTGSSADDPYLKGVKAKAQVRLAAAQAEIDTIYAEGKDQLDAARAARAEVRAAEAAGIAAQNEVAQAAGRPVSVFISRKTQRLYVRRAFQPVFEIPVTIHRPHAPIGTTIFTAMDWSEDEAGLRWTALPINQVREAGSWRLRGAGLGQAAAKAALERIAMPQDAIDRISALVTPGSSLIISDEALSHETGEATDFVVLMGGGGQGGARRSVPDPYSSEGPFAPGAPFSWW
jgi:L,D-transpeptidase catalytic domain